MNALLLALACLAVQSVAEYVEREDDGQVYVDDSRRLVLGSTNGVVVPLGKLLIPDPSAAVAGSDDAAGAGGGEQKMIDVAENVANLTARMGVVAEKLQRLANETASSSMVTENKTGTLFGRLGANVDAVVQLSSTVEALTANQTRHTSEVAQLSSTVEALTANQTRHTSEVAQLSSTVEELTANQTKLQALHAADVATITDLLNRIIPQDSDLDLGCKVSAWSNWGTCSQPCGPGKRTRTREVEKVGLLADPSITCPSTSETEGCEMKACPVDCKIGDWSDWHGCIPSCGPDSEKARYRRITTLEKHDGKPCGGVVETVKCNATCPADSCQGGVFSKVADLEKLNGCTFVSGSIEMINLVAASDEDRTIMAGYTENVTEVTGSVKFFNCDGLQDLGMFASLAKLGGSFEVKGCPDFTSAVGVDKLAHVGGDVVFQNVQNSAFTSFDGFNAVTHVGGKIYFVQVGSTDTGETKDFKMFASLERVDGGDLYISGLGRVSNYHTSFANLDYVGGSVFFSNSFDQCFKTKLFSNLTTVGGSASEATPSHLLGGITFNGFNNDYEACKSPGVWFPELETAPGGVSFSHLYNFEIAGAFPKLKEARTIQLGNSGRYNSFVATEGASVFGALREVTHDLFFYNVDTAHCKGDCTLDTTEWFPVLTRVGNDLKVHNSEAIRVLRFKSLESVGDVLEVTLDRILSTIDFSKLKSVKEFNVARNDGLAMCLKKYNRLINSVTQSNAANQIQPGTIVESC